MGLPTEVPDGQVNIALMQLAEAGRAYEAHSGLCRIRNSQSRLHTDMDSETLKQRQMFLDVATRVLHSEILDAYDKACVEYLKARNLLKP